MPRAYGILKKRSDFVSIAKTGGKWVSETVIVQSIQPAEADALVFGFTATKKIGNAVTRNRAKRRLRAAVQEIAAAHDLKPSQNVLIARDVTASCEWSKLVKDLRWCLKRLDLLS